MGVGAVSGAVRKGEPKLPPLKNKPRCRVHGREMVYRPERFVWTCPDPGCTLVAFPPQDLDRGKPLVATDPLELVIIDNESPSETAPPQVYLRSGNVLIELTSYVMKIEEAHDFQTLKPCRFVTLRVKNAIRRNGFGETPT